VAAEQGHTNRATTLEFNLDAITSERTSCPRTRDSKGGTDALGTMANEIKRAASFARPNDGAITAHNDRRLLFRNRLNGVA
jgi:hypothetical protein